MRRRDFDIEKVSPIAGLGLVRPAPLQAAGVTLLNVSYDPTRELYKDINAALRRAVEGQDRRGGEDQPVATGAPARNRAR